jgi:hypothetical protein
MRLIQLSHSNHGRRIAQVKGSKLVLIEETYRTCYDLFSTLFDGGQSPAEFISSVLTDNNLNYNEVYSGNSSWKILPSFDHPKHPMFCMLSGTGLTHKASAENRQKMHQQASEKEDITDSMEIYLWGEEGGKPKPGEIGVQPEWFYKGNGTALQGIGDPLEVPPYGDDGGEEPEIAGVYLISPDKTPYRIGFTLANEFSDHIMEKKNYLYLAPSKLRKCAIGPELVLDSDFQDIPGKVSVERNGEEIWSKSIKSGEKNMSHSLANLEHHHFKYKQHLIPGMVHIHFFGADAFSFGDNMQLQDGDMMNISFDGFGKPLKNPININNMDEELLTVQTFG